MPYKCLKNVNVQLCDYLYLSTALRTARSSPTFLRAFESQGVVALQQYQLMNRVIGRAPAGVSPPIMYVSRVGPANVVPANVVP